MLKEYEYEILARISEGTKRVRGTVHLSCMII
jgi:hypothetical protein